MVLAVFYLKWLFHLILGEIYVSRTAFFIFALHPRMPYTQIFLYAMQTYDIIHVCIKAQECLCLISYGNKYRILQFQPITPINPTISHLYVPLHLCFLNLSHRQCNFVIKISQLWFFNRIQCYQRKLYAKILGNIVFQKILHSHISFFVARKSLFNAFNGDILNAGSCSIQFKIHSYLIIKAFFIKKSGELKLAIYLFYLH